jgi:hypothetical protein
MKNIRKFLNAACLALALMLAIVGTSLGTTSASALVNSPPKVMSTESLSKKAALVLREEYTGGVHSEHNQWIQYGYDLTTLGEYDYIHISFESSLTVVLFDNTSITYQYDTVNRYLEVGFQAAADTLDFNDFSIENTKDGKVTVSMAVYIANDLVQFNEYHVSVHITPYGSFSAPYDIKSAKWTYNEWLFEEEIIDFAEYKSRDDSLFLATMQGTGMPFSPMSSGTITGVVATDVTVNYTVTFNGSTSVTISGTVQWTDTNGTAHPARKVLVEVYLPGSLSNFFADSLLVKLETNNQGVFSASNLPNAGLEVRLKIHASTKDGLGVEPYGLFDGIYSFSTDFVSTSNNYFARERGTDAADAFYVHQAVIVGHAYASAMGYSNTPTVTFPRSATQYNSATDTLWIITEDYCDFDVILHEYGHYIMDKLNFEDSPGGDHARIMTDYYQHKDKGIKFAWSEGWATYFGISAQLHQNIASFSIPNAGNAVYDDTIDGNMHFDLNWTASTYIGAGEGNEEAVARVVFNIANNGILSYQSIWNICNNSKAKHLSDFMAQVYANTPKSQISAIGTILQSQNITPTLPTLPSDILNYNSPNLNWTVSTGNVSTTYLDSFMIVFIDLNYNIQYSIDCSNNKSQDISNHINTIIQKFPSSEFFYGIQVNQYDTSANTGPYFSTLRRISGIMKYTYLSSSDSYELSSITRVSGSVTIPSTYNGKSVTAIGASAFANQTMCNEVVIPNSVTYIGSNAFENCTSLTNVTLPNSITAIESSTFNGCSILSSIIIPSSVTRIGSGAFKNCRELTSITLSDNITTIGVNVFENCTSLTNVTLSNTLTTIESSTFNGCSSLSSIIIPSSVTRINSGAFQNCSVLTSITISDNITTIGVTAFYGCSNLTIYITGMTCVPNGWNNYWNPSNRPIYFNGILHTHNKQGKEFTGDQYHGIKKLHYYGYRYYCTECKFTLETKFEAEPCDGPPCPTPYRLPHLSDIDHFDGSSLHNESLNSFNNKTVVYLPSKKENISAFDYL